MSRTHRKHPATVPTAKRKFQQADLKSHKQKRTHVRSKLRKEFG